ncbi:hypothetical protein C8R30_104106 [Nitrosomonas nitrosa]|uniref:Uncharacterized protein n=1 Tax=Nitrosomonas nitrosa TaxID=52442 RepID=A0A1I4QWD0_9PROT|nr:hypothetical protein C8R30_104106 [Nitrosomonas nitrosa]SFM43983.1 hypothetical protein SAMN05421880_11664 [Nitrosomonas nitrosa]
MHDVYNRKIDRGLVWILKAETAKGYSLSWNCPNYCVPYRYAKSGELIDEYLWVQSNQAVPKKVNTINR